MIDASARPRARGRGMFLSTVALALAAGLYSGLSVLVGGGVPFTSLVISSVIVVGRGGVHMLLASIRSKPAGGGAELRSVLF
jgi:hypothetical protein